MSRDWRTYLVFLPVALLFFALYGPVLFAPAGHAPATHDADFFLYYYPMTTMAFGMWRDHGFPLWNPYIYSGMPMLPSMEVGLLYPPNWLHLLMSTERAFCLLYVFHILLAAWGMWRYVRGRGRSVEAALASVMAYTFAAPTILHFDMGLTSVVYSSAWLPMIFALIDRCLRQRTFHAMTLLSLALACQFLAGFPMFTLLLALLIPAYLLCFGVDWSAPFGRGTASLLLTFGAAAVIALGLVAPQLLPTWQHLMHAHRTELGYAQATHCSFPAVNLLTFAVPDVLGNNRSCPYWGEVDLFDVNAFCGVTTLFFTGLALIRWRRREVLFWSLSVLVIVAFSLGKDSAFYDLCFYFLPVVDWFRGISRLMIFASLGLAILAGIGVEDFLTATRRTGQIRYAAVVGALAVGVLVIAASWWSQATPPRWWEEFFDWVRRPGREVFTQYAVEARRTLLAESFHVMSQSVAASMAIMLICCGLLCLFRSRRAGMAALLSVLAWELYAFNARYITLMDTAPWGDVARRIRAAIPQEASPYRIAMFGQSPSVPANRSVYERLEGVGGHENFVHERYSLFLYKWCGIMPKWQTYLSVPDHRHVYDVLNVRYYLHPRRQWHDPADPLVQEDVFRLQNVAFDLYRNERALARAILIHHADVVSGLDTAVEALPRLHEHGIEKGTCVEHDVGSLLPISEAERQRESVKIQGYAPGRIEADVHCASPALLVFIENFDDGWQATVDGAAVDVFPANVFMTALSVPAGAHRVVLEYRPRSFIVGCRFAGLSAAILIAGWAVSVYRAGRGIPVTKLPGCS